MHIEENIYTGTIVNVKAGFCGYPFKGIVMDSLARHNGQSNSFLDATMYRVAEITSDTTVPCAVKAIRKWVPCELMYNHDTSRAQWAQDLLREYVSREVDEVPAMCAARLEELANARK